MKVAVIGIGSNSLRMLLAEISGKSFQRIKRYREGLRIFDALDSNRCISQSMIDTACKAICLFITEAKNDGAENFFLFATSAVRDAANKIFFSEEIKRVTGLNLHICSGEEEAALSFMGAVDLINPSAVIDIGGGSTEIAIGISKPLFARSYQIGAVRLWKNHKINSIYDVKRIVESIKEEMIVFEGPISSFTNLEWVGVGGTFTTAAAFVQKINWNDRHLIDGFILEKHQVDCSIEELLQMPWEEKSKHPSIQPQRADIIIHGLCILKASMECFGVSKIRISECGNLEGYLKMLLIS